GSGASDLMIDRSAEAVTVVDAVAVLLAGLGSEVAALTVAVLVIVPPSLGAVTTIVMGGAAPGGRLLARLQVTLALVPLHVQPMPLALWKVTPAGSVSMTVIGAAAVLGPALLTASVYVNVPPAITGSGASVLMIDRSAEAVTVVDAVAVLLAGLGSEVAALTAAVLVMVPPSLGAVTTIVIVEGVPPVGARLARVQVTLYSTPLRAQPVPLALWKVTPAGSVSVTLTLLAVEGPPLLTVSVLFRVPPALTGSGALSLLVALPI